MLSNLKIRISIIITLFILVIIGAYKYFVADKEIVANTQNGKILATINGEPFYQAQAERRLRIMLKDNQNIDYKNLTPELINVAVKEEAAQRVFAKIAKENNLENNPQIRQKLDLMQERLIQNTILSSVINNNLTEDKIKNKYDAIKKELSGKKEVNVSHILVSDEKKAKEISHKLAKNKNKKSINENFAKIATKNSIDSNSAKNGGNLGFVLEDSLTKNIDPEFAKAALKLKKGKISDPVKTKFGWHIIKLEDKRNAKAAPYEEVRTAITKNMAANIQKNYVDNLLKDIKIEIVN